MCIRDRFPCCGRHRGSCPTVHSHSGDEGIWSAYGRWENRVPLCYDASIDIDLVVERCIIMRTLVVEDDEMLRDVIVRGLRQAGLAVDEAPDGDAALELIDLYLYDVVVLDRQLPGQHGDDVCRAMQTLQRSPRVLMLTASGTIRELIDLYLYDVVVLDRQLPGQHGDDVCRAMQTLQRSPRVLMLTASGTIRD